MSPLPLLLALALGAETQIDAGVRLQGEARRLDPRPAGEDARSLDLSAIPRAAIRVEEGRASASATYEPRFSVADVGPESRTEAMHQGTVQLRFTQGARFELETFASGAAGRTDMVTERRSGGLGGATGGADLDAGGGTAGETSAVLGTQRIDVENLRAGLSLRIAAGPRTDLLLSGAASQDGGAGASSQALLPVVRGVEAQAELRRAVTPLDRIGLRLSGTAARIARYRADSAWASALATWRRRLSPHADLWSGAGAVVFQSRLPREDDPSGRSTDRRCHPAAELGLARLGEAPASAGEGQELTGVHLAPTGELVGTLGATMDRLTGLTSPSLQARANLRWPLSRTVALVALGSGGFRWRDEERTREGRLDLGASFQLTPQASLDVTGYGTWQRSDDRDVADVNVYGAIVSVALEAPPLRF